MKMYRVLSRVVCWAAFGVMVPMLGCADLSEPWQLNYARVLAVQATPPGVAPLQTTTLTALVFDGAAVREVTMTDVVVPAPFAALLLPASAPAVWQAADATVVARELAAQQVPAGEALVVPVTTSVTLAGVDGPLKGVKHVRVGVAAANPVAPAVLVDGVEQREVTLHVHQVVQLSAAGAPGLTYVWASTHGELKRAAAANSQLTATELGDGVLVVVVRDGVGGVAWTHVPLHVVP